MSASIPAVNPADDRAFLQTRHRGLLLVAVMAMSIAQFLDLTIATVILPNMQTSLGASADTISWVLTSFIIAGVLVLPLTGWLSDRFGSRNLFIAASAMFVFSSMLCGAATSLTEMVIFRAIQGMSSAFIGPLSQTIVFDISPPSKQARAMALWGMSVMIAPISGPFIGGYLAEWLNWRWVFYINLPLGIPALALLWWLLPSRPIIRRKLDLFGAAMLSVGLVALQLVLDRGQQEDWLHSAEIVVELLVSLSAFWIFIVHTRTTATPLFDGALIRNKSFLLGLLFMIVLGVTNVALSSTLPTLYQNIYGYDVVDTGIMMAPRGVGILLTMVLVNRLIGKVDPRLLITVGYCIAALSLWMMSGWSLEMGQQHIIVTGLIQGLGLGLTFVPVNLMAFSSLAPNYRTDGSTLLTLFRNLGASIGISVIVTMLARNMQTSHADIAANVTSFNLPAIDPASAADLLGSLGDSALSILNGEITRQAAMIAYIDNFYMMFWIMLIFVPLAWLAKPPPIVPGMRPLPSE